MDCVKDTEMKGKITGVATQMETFHYLYGVVLGQMILSHSDNLSCTLQKRNISAAEGREVAEMVSLTSAFISFGKGWLSRQKTCTSLKHSWHGEGKCQDVLHQAYNGLYA